MAAAAWLAPGCDASPVAPVPGPGLPVHYVAVDVDDVFQPNWDAAAQKRGTVKMQAADVAALVELSAALRREFTPRFRFSLGYNSAFFDSAQGGDRAFLEHAGEFVWFNHLPRHEHVVDASLSQGALERLFLEGESFTAAHGMQPFCTDYLVTPQQQGIWPPYEPLYAVFERHGIRYTASPALLRPATYGSVRIGHRTNLGLSSGQYGLAQVSPERLELLARAACDSVAAREAVVFHTHQANYARDRLGNRLIARLAALLAGQDTLCVEFVTAAEVVAQQTASSRVPPPGAPLRRPALAGWRAGCLAGRGAAGRAARRPCAPSGRPQPMRRRRTR